MFPLALAWLAACTPEPSADPPDAIDTTPDTLPGDPCWGPPTHSGEADVVRIGNLRDDDTPIGFLPVEGAPVERAAVVEGRLSWATPGATDTIGQDTGRRVVLFSMSAFPRRVASVPLPAGRAPLAVAHCGDHVFLTYLGDDGSVALQRDDEVVTSFASAQTPVCSGDTVGIRVDDGGAAWWWIDGTAPAGQSVAIPADAFPVTEAPGGWLLVSPTTASRIEPTGAVVPLGLEGTFVASVSDVFAWTVVADQADGTRRMIQVDQQGQTSSPTLAAAPGALVAAGSGAAVWIGEDNAATAVHGYEVFSTRALGWPMWEEVRTDTGRMMWVRAKEGTFVINDATASMDYRSGTLPLLPVEAAALRWTPYGLLDLPPGVTLGGRAAADADVPSLAMVTWRYGEMNPDECD